MPRLLRPSSGANGEVVTPIDIEIDKDLDVSRPSVRRAIHAVLPQVILIAGAMSCATKSRAREKQPGPPPLRSEESPRGLPGIPERSQQRVDADNYSSDYLLALHTWIAQHGLGGLRENPLRSLHWWDPIELHVTQQSTWHDLDYDACVFGGARKKSQRFRHNIPELAALPAVRCGHVHDPRKWSSPVEGGFATFAEAEYTPSLVFTLAVACTAWAASRGYLVTQVPRLPPISLSGDHRPLLQFEPSELRQELMDVMGFHLGLSPPGVDASFVPARLVASEVLLTRKHLQENEIYIGPGHFSHRWPLSQWQNPFRVGEGRTSSESVLQFARWIHDQTHLLEALPSLHGCTLICDCPHNQLCHGDILRALIWTTTTSRPTLPRRHHRQGVRKVALLAAGLRPVRAVPIRFSQETVISALMAMCPHIHWSGFQWPMIEDLLVDDSHFVWLATMQTRDDWQGQAFGPSLVGPIERAAISLHGFQQAGAAAAAKAMPPLIPFGVGEERHFELVMELKAQPTPFESMGIVDDDLLFAADQYRQLGASLRQTRHRMTRWIHELARRTWPITEWLRQFQPQGPARATKGRHIALIGLLMMFIGWPDPTFMECLIFGFPSVGFSPHVPVYKAQPASYITSSEVVHGAWQDADRLIRTLQPRDHDEAIAKAGSDDEALGFCGPALSWSQLCQQVRHFRLIRRFCIQQPSGKLRVIDDAADGGQSELSHDSNKLDLCTSIQPGLRVQLLWRAVNPLPNAGTLLADGYRHVSMVPEHSDLAVVAYYDHHVGAPRFRRYYGSLFGLPNAVCSFNRFPRFFQALCRRMGYCLASMYFDDLTVQDLGSFKGSAQQFITSLATELGSPFQPEKHQVMQSPSDFLGLVHDVTNCHRGQPVRFWPRERLITKVTDLMDEAIQTNRLPPGLAAKLFGCLGFLNTGCFGKLGRSGLSPLKERQYSRDTALTEDLSRSFVTIKSLLALRPERELPLQPGSQQRYLAASDAAQDEPRQGSAGLLFVGPQGERDAYVVDITAELFNLWSDHPTKIAQLELLTVYVGFIFVASQARSCQGLWFVDNIAALMALIKGRSDNPELDTMAGCIHALLYSLRSGCYFEWVQSKDNWSDGISRQGIHDKWYQAHGFRVHRVPVPHLLLRLPYVIIHHVFQFF